MLEHDASTSRYMRRQGTLRPVELLKQLPYPAQHDKNWYRLDNAGKIYPALLSRRISSLFRISLNLQQPISLPLMEQAIAAVMPRFPYYQVSLRPGFFWYFLETNARTPPIEGDSRHPCTQMPVKKRGMFLFRVRIYRSRIAVEFSHILTDGNGALVFLKTLSAQYLRLQGHVIDSDDALGILALDAPVPEGEYEDAFYRYYNRRLPSPTRSAHAFHLRRPLIPPGHYHIITGTLSVSAVKALYRQYQVSLSELLIATLIASYQDYMQSYARASKPIRMNVPVNLRSLYPSQSMRNFFLPVEPWIDPRLGHYDFEEICSKVHHYMRYEVDRKFLNQQITRNMKGELNMINRLFPLRAKNVILPLVYQVLGENNYSSGFSNLGRIELPEAMQAAVRSFDFYPPPSTGNQVKCTALSYQDELKISFGSLIEETHIERLFFTRLRNMGVPVQIESNRPH